MDERREVTPALQAARSRRQTSREEWNTYKAYVTPYELDRYLPIP